MIIPRNDGFTLEFVSGTIRAARRRGGGESYTRVKRAIATYRIVPGYRVSLAGRWSRGRDSRYKTAGRDVMNAWNLSMDGAPMINRASRRRGSLYSREAAGGREEERGEGGRRREAGRECLPSTRSSYRAMPRGRADKSVPVFMHGTYGTAGGDIVYVCMYVCIYVSSGRVYAVIREYREIGAR